MPTERAASSSPRLSDLVGAAEHLGLIGARDDADGERAGHEGRHADEAFRAEQAADGAERGAAAEIEQVDDEKVRDAAQDGGVAVSEAARDDMLRESLAQATKVPTTAPARKPQSATASVMPVAVRRARPQPFGPKPDELEIAQLLHASALSCYASSRERG